MVHVLHQQQNTINTLDNRKRFRNNIRHKTKNLHIRTTNYRIQSKQNNGDDKKMNTKNKVDNEYTVRKTKMIATTWLICISIIAFTIMYSSTFPYRMQFELKTDDNSIKMLELATNKNLEIANINNKEDANYETFSKIMIKQCKAENMDFQYITQGQTVRCENETDAKFYNIEFSINQHYTITNNIIRWYDENNTQVFQKQLQ